MIEQAEASADQKKLQIKWQDGSMGSLPFAWLRDVSEDHKILHMNELSMEVRPEKIELVQQGQELRIQWPPYDVSSYATEWLWDHSHHLASQPIGPALWGSGFKIPEFSNDLAGEAPKLKAAWDAHGILKVKAGHNLAEGDFLHLFGHSDLVCVGSSEKELSKAYPLSTQHPERAQLPRVHAVKCLKPGQGVLMVADGAHVAHVFQSQYPELFEFAASRAITYQHSKPTLSRAARPIFSLHPKDGRLQHVCFNNPLRQRDVLLPQRAQHLLFKSMKVFNHITMSNTVDVPMSEGDILLIDNHRVISGNAPFAPIDDKPAPLPAFRLSSYGPVAN